MGFWETNIIPFYKMDTKETLPLLQCNNPYMWKSLKYGIVEIEGQLQAVDNKPCLLYTIGK